MRKIRVTRQFFELAAPRVTFSKKQKNPFFDMVQGSVCVYIGFRLARRFRTNHNHVDIV